MGHPRSRAEAQATAVGSASDRVICFCFDDLEVGFFYYLLCIYLLLLFSGKENDQVQRLI